MRLYEIKDNYLSLLDMIENGEIPEEAISDTLEAVSGELEEKADNIACIIKNELAEIDAIKAEEQALAERRRAKERNCDRLKAYLSDNLQAAGINKFETARNKISFRRSSALEIADESAFIMWASEYAPTLLKTSVAANKTAIKDYMALGNEIDGVKIAEKFSLQLK